jgi:hypothetical protein
MNNGLGYYIWGAIMGFASGVAIFWALDSNEIKSPHPVTPRIEIHIKPDGSRDTMYIYKEVSND